MPPRTVVLILVCLVTAAFSSCSGTSSTPTCSSANCGGCCDEHGVCQPGAYSLACGSQGATCVACSLSQTCNAASVCIDTQPERDAGRFDAGAGDAGADAGVADAGAVDAGIDAGVDAGDPCVTGRLYNGDFECGLTGWSATLGTLSRVTTGATSGQAFAQVVADSSGGLQMGSTVPIEVASDSKLCLRAMVRGDVPQVRVEVRVTPSNVATTFDSPVTSTWGAVPPSIWLSVNVPKASQASVVVKGVGASVGQVLQVDQLEVVDAPLGFCP